MFDDNIEVDDDDDGTTVLCFYNIKKNVYCWFWFKSSKFKDKPARVKIMISTTCLISDEMLNKFSSKTLNTSGPKRIPKNKYPIKKININQKSTNWEKIFIKKFFL